jgi:hypothetical protein
MHHAGVGAVPLVVAVDFLETRIWRLEHVENDNGKRITAATPWGIHKLHSKKVDSIDLHSVSAYPEYRAALSKAVAGATDIVLLGHGKGKANASHLFAGYLEKHHKDVAHRIQGEIRCDIDSITDAQLMQIGRDFFERLDVLA